MKLATAAAIALALSACALAPFRPNPQQVGWCADYHAVERDAALSSAIRRLDLLYAARDWPVDIWRACGMTAQAEWRQADLDAATIVENVSDQPWPLRLAGWRFASHHDWKRAAEARCRARDLDGGLQVALLCADSLKQAGLLPAAVEAYRAAYWKAASRDERLRTLDLLGEASANPDVDFEGIPPAVVAEWREQRARDRAAAEQQRQVALRQNAERQRQDALAARQRKWCEAQCKASEERCGSDGVAQPRCSEEEHACRTACAGY